ncbi:pilus assembly protein TadG-related protein [Microbacterium sp. ARD32]|uniref:pilus assembly protein TadG-related protein n=1 Tax=Microbacterium sp. ARD32 TaxID=2962577 RepID=UPI002882841D|nr:pilus assembly protein TadG-related protein [Microbacterium sp. ARD32]MDT0158619.1 pilus assembly protein TadG-related protein [Microbacterium sp. ARD32]
MSRRRALGRRLRLLGNDEDGSILPLILGYVLLAIAVVIVCTCATDLYIAQKRLDSLADAASLAGADGFTLELAEGDVHAELTDAQVSEQADAVIDAVAPKADLLSADTPDGVSARVSVATVWHPPLISPFVPDGVRLESTATTRTALR